MSFASQKGSGGERELLAVLIKAGYPGARRVGHQQRISGPKPPDVDGTPYYAENKSRAGIPVAIWRYFEECLENRPSQDRRPVLVRVKRTGRKFPPLILMLESDWLEREKAMTAASSSESAGQATST